MLGVEEVFILAVGIKYLCFRFDCELQVFENIQLSGINYRDLDCRGTEIVE